MKETTIPLTPQNIFFLPKSQRLEKPNIVINTAFLQYITVVQINNTIPLFELIDPIHIYNSETITENKKIVFNWFSEKKKPTLKKN